MGGICAGKRKTGAGPLKRDDPTALIYAAAVIVVAICFLFLVIAFLVVGIVLQRWILIEKQNRLAKAQKKSREATETQAPPTRFSTESDRLLPEDGRRHTEVFGSSVEFVGELWLG